MLDFRISSHSHFDEACRKFAETHKVRELAIQAGIKPHTLYNKLNPEQPHQLTPREIWVLTDITEDSTLVDGFLAQIHCLPCVPVNELAKDKLQSYVMHAMSKLGELASGAVSTERLTPARKNSMVESINSGIRMLSLSAMALQARLQTNPAMSSVVDSVSGISASFGLI
ncbi:phage regulatory CII family protein [Cedecea davisae]|uniref:Phage regulatory CII family protein n=1 Tax=Cedecea davisae TaxID=158484 RepID=A0ABS6DBD8_9ENTR|nr:phage regulatory CII family protein [Cedecea davisae]MBU4680418.1 phage regulatory CII family protein [Cedecea davisae]MBU4684910.1 phage regulatory CII family protein [Cedecea davisae]